MSTIGTTMPAVAMDHMTIKRRAAAVRRKSAVVTEEGIQERLGMRRRASTVRKAAIFESLGKWEADEDLIFQKNKSPQGANGNKTMRRKSFDVEPFIIPEEEMQADSVKKSNRAKSAEPAQRPIDTTSPWVSKQNTSKKDVGSNSSLDNSKRSLGDSKRLSMPTAKQPATVSTLSPKRSSAPLKDSSGSTHETSTKRVSPRRSSRKVRRASGRSVQKEARPTNLDQLLEASDDSKKNLSSGSTNSGSNSANGSSSVVSAPSKLPSNRAKRRSSKQGPKSAKNMANGQPRRAKSSDLAEVAEGQLKPRRSKRRSKSADNDEDFGPDIMVEVKSEKSKKKGRMKRRSSHKRASVVQSNDAAENDSQTNPQSKPQDRRASLAGTKKRAHSAGPLKRNKTGEEDEKPALPARAASMMLHRDNTRRGKANSLHDLVQYTADEIHSTSYFASNHVLVNRERMKRGLRPLTRNIAMDTLARESAEAMAKSAGTSPLRTTYVGNLLRGESIRAVHRAVMLNKQGRERANILNPYFQDFGVGTAKGKDDMLYVCQLFSERLELSCTNLATDEEGKSD